MKRLIAVVGPNAATFKTWMRERFKDHEIQSGTYYPHEPAIVFDEGEEEETEFRFFHVHSPMTFRGRTFFAYVRLSDCREIPEETLALIRIACERHPKKRGRGI